MGAARPHHLSAADALDKRVPRLPIVYYISAAIGFIIGLLAGTGRGRKTT
jgi:hypothetical protein